MFSCLNLPYCHPKLKAAKKSRGHARFPKLILIQGVPWFFRSSMHLFGRSFRQLHILNAMELFLRWLTFFCHFWMRSLFARHFQINGYFVQKSCKIRVMQIVNLISIRFYLLRLPSDYGFISFNCHI